jgi:hypothetical protein
MSFDKYCVPKSYKEFPVMLPREGQPFRVHTTEVKRDIWLTRRDSVWYVVGHELAKSRKISSVNISDLYFGVYENGDEFIIPVTRCYNGKGNSFTHSLMEIIEKAKVRWMIRTATFDDEYRAKPAKGADPKPHWESDFGESLNYAFDDTRRIDKFSDIFPKSNKENMYEEEY